MAATNYTMPTGVHAIPPEHLDIRPDAEVDHDLLNPEAITNSDKNVWFFWHSGFTNMHPYTQRNVRAWHRRFSKQGWIIRVIDRQPASPLNVERFLDTKDLETFPQAFVDGRIGGQFGAQHTSDLVRFPLLLKYGGVYADVGLMQIGDLDRLWDETVGDPHSPHEVISFNCGGVEERNLANYFLASRRNNPFFDRCHWLFLELWTADGGKTDTEGMHASPLLKGVPVMSSSFEIEENGTKIGADEVSKMLTDYITQGQVMRLVMQLQDDEDGWNGPEYVAKHVYAMEYMVGSQLINDYTAWNGQRAFALMTMKLPAAGESETEDHKLAREIVEACLQRSFSFKLAHGLIIRVLGDTLGSLWRKHEGSDNVPGTYAHWLRYDMVHWCPDEGPEALQFEALEPLKRGPLLRTS